MAKTSLGWNRLAMNSMGSEGVLLSTAIQVMTLCFAIFAVTAAAQTPESVAHQHKAETMTKIRMTVGGQEIIALLNDSAAARDFLSLLPMTLTLDDYHKTEKVSDLPKRLSTEGSPGGFDPSVGDITYYAPWGNLAIFYRDFGYAGGLVHLGVIESGMEFLNREESFEVKIERVD